MAKAKASPLGSILETTINTALPASTTQERLHRIEILGKRVHEYIQFMCRVDDLNGNSAEAKGKAVTAFCECLTVMERRLGRIHDDFQLG
jgi:hypothetical protein